MAGTSRKPLTRHARTRRSNERRRSALPNILVYIDVRGGLPTGPTLFALSEARRVARLAGASVYAVALVAPMATAAVEALARPIAEAGADKLLLCESDEFAGPALDPTHARGLDTAAARVVPLLVLFPAGGAGEALGPPLAARLGGPFAPWCDFLTSDAEEPTPDGAARVQLIHCRPDGRSRRRLDSLELERPIVATLGAGRRPAPSGSMRDLEVEVLARGSAPMPHPLPVSLSSEPHPEGHLPLASMLVLVGDQQDGSPVIPLDDLRQALTARDAVVARASQLSDAIAARCCPDIVLKLGPSAVRTGRSPRTRVVLAAVAQDPSEPPFEDVDLFWQFQSPGELTIDSVATLLGEIGGRT